MEEIGLSEKGISILKENGITMEMLCKFTEHDIGDLFKTAEFADRFHLRQYLCNKKTSNSTPAKQSQSDMRQFCQPEVASASGSHVQLHLGTKSAPSKVTKPEYEVIDMLRTKDRRGTPSKAQKYFQSLLRDAANSCGLWKKPPRMSQISAKRKELFLKSIIEACPQLGSFKKEVWAKFRACIQNRRKYIHDRASGKRKLKSQLNNTCTSDDGSASCSNSNAREKTDDVKEGSPVLLYGNDKRVLGKAIYLQKRDDTYSEIIIQSLSTDCSEKLDCELPEAVEGHTSLCNALIKKKIVWKTKRLNIHTGKQQLLTKTSKAKGTVKKRKLPNIDETESSTTGVDSDESDNTISSTPDVVVEPSPMKVLDGLSTNRSENLTKGKKLKKVSKSNDHDQPKNQYCSRTKQSESLMVLPKAKSIVRKRKLPNFDDGDEISSSDVDSLYSDDYANSTISSTPDVDAQPSPRPIQVTDNVKSNLTKGKKLKSISKSTEKPTSVNSNRTKGKFNARKFDGDHVEDEKLCIYEWSGGNFYFGISYFENCVNPGHGNTTTKRRFKIINCVKPIASMDSTGFVKVVAPFDSGCLKLNFGDIQSDPDPGYKIYELADSLWERDLQEKNVVLLGNKDVTMKYIRMAINRYIDG